MSEYNNSVGLYVYANGSPVTVYDSSVPGVQKVQFVTSGYVGRSNGYTVQRSGKTWLGIDPGDGYDFSAFVEVSKISLSTTQPTEEQVSQQGIDIIVSFDQRTVTNLLTAAQLCVEAEKRGYYMADEKTRIASIYASVEDRNQQLVDNPNFKEVEQAQSTLSPFAPALEAILSGGSYVGIAWVPIIVVAAIVIGGGLYIAIQNNAKNSVQDFDDSDDEINRILNELSEKDRNTLVAEINSQLKENYSNGYWKGLGSRAKWLVYGVIAVGAYIAYDIFLKKK